MRTQVGIVGAGPAGLLLSQLLALRGIESVVIENRSREYCVERQRAGVLEHVTTEALIAAGVGERLLRERILDPGVALRFGGRSRFLNFEQLTGKAVTVYPQHNVVRDMIDVRLAAGARIDFEVSEVTLHDIGTTSPSIRYRDRDGNPREILCDFIAGCDGYHGIARPSIPAGVLTEYERVYPFAWLGILSDAPPFPDLMYCLHERGFALLSKRTDHIGRIYLQVPFDEDPARWTAEEFWDELYRRLEGDEPVRPAKGPLLGDFSIAQLRSWVCEPMQFGRLYLCGDAAHIVPPTGAKGMNQAIADVTILARALQAHYTRLGDELLEQYSATALRRIWKVEKFSWYMSQMLHRFPNNSPFEYKMQLAELDYVTSSDLGARALAEQYVGLPLE